ncbi:MAG: ferritin family protein [Candidatus Latescibacteria bacterium]|nr:ferritin family protein [Candidatus Latescibacterota bacterium]
MSITFNADEVFEMAEQIERNGAKFYRRAADNTDDAEAGKKLLNLAAMEDEHEKIFGAMRTDLSLKNLFSTTFDPFNEQAMYLRAMADTNVFNLKADPSEKLTGRESLEEIYKTAIGLEKDSIIFYIGIRDMIPGNLGKDKIELIIKEEKKHIVDLTEQLKAL